MNKGTLIISLLFCIMLVIVVVVMTKSGNKAAPPTPEQEPVVTEEEEEDVLVEPSTPSDPYESATWEEVKASQRPGHPVVETVNGTQVNHYPVGASWYLVGKGRAPTAKDCWEFSKRNKINTYAWRKGDKSCWAYQDSFIYQGGMEPTSVSNHVSGCTLPGRKLKDGCEDLNRGDIAIGHKHGSEFVPIPEELILAASKTKKMSLAKCREVIKEANQKALERGEPNDTVYAVGYRTNKHPSNDWTNTCFAYKNPRQDLKGWFGNQNDVAHVTACVDPTKKVRDGCV